MKGLLDYADRIEKAAPYLRNGNIARWCKTIVADMRDDAAIAPQGEAVETIKRIAAQLATDDCEGDAADLLEALHALATPQATPAAVDDAIYPSSGNVFRDLNLPNPDVLHVVAEMRLCATEGHKAGPSMLRGWVDRLQAAALTGEQP